MGTHYDITKVDFDKEVFSVLKGKGNQLYWALFETRLRDVILEIVEPLSDHTKEASNKAGTFIKELEIMKRQVQEIGFDMQKVQRQSDEFV